MAKLLPLVCPARGLCQPQYKQQPDLCKDKYSISKGSRPWFGEWNGHSTTAPCPVPGLSSGASSSATHKWHIQQSPKTLL